MIWFVISIILLLFSAAVTGVALSNNVKGAGIGLIPGLVGLLLLIPACLYSVDVGEVAVIRNMGGSLAGHSEDAGFHWKTPWQSVIKYDTRNNLINFYKDTDYKYDGGSAVGKQVTVNDRSGASADIDIQVNYSLDPSAAEYLYSEYGKQQTFTQNYISNDLRSVAREQSGRFDTLTMLTNRGEYTKAVQDVLTDRKVDGALRDRVPMLCREKEVLWIAGVTAGNLPHADEKEKLWTLRWSGCMPWLDGQA